MLILYFVENALWLTVKLEMLWSEKYIKAITLWIQKINKIFREVPPAQNINFIIDLSKEAVN